MASPQGGRRPRGRRRPGRGRRRVTRKKNGREAQAGLTSVEPRTECCASHPFEAFVKTSSRAASAGTGALDRHRIRSTPIVRQDRRTAGERARNIPPRTRRLSRRRHHETRCRAVLLRGWRISSCASARIVPCAGPLPERPCGHVLSEARDGRDRWTVWWACRSRRPTERQRISPPPIAKGSWRSRRWACWSCTFGIPTRTHSNVPICSSWISIRRGAAVFRCRRRSPADARAVARVGPRHRS